MFLGCSSKLSRREAAHQIDAMMKPHPVGPKKVMSPGGVPGFQLASEDEEDSDSVFQIADHEVYGDLVTDNGTRSPNDEDYLVNALGKMGYVTVAEEGPKGKLVGGITLHYAHSRSVHLTQKVGAVTMTGYSKNYESGLSCYPPPEFSQCNAPPLVEIGKDYTITGIVQNETQGRVNVLIPWKLTRFGMDLRLECPVLFVPVKMRQTGTRGAIYGTREEAHSGADCEPAAAG
jgi:hypothetical protein